MIDVLVNIDVPEIEPAGSTATPTSPMSGRKAQRERPKRRSRIMTDLLVIIDVPDLESATAFYTRAFDLTVGRGLGEGSVELLGSGPPIFLLAKPEGSRATPTSTDRRRYRRHWTPVHLDFVVVDLDAAIAQAEAAGAKVETPIRTAAWGRIAVLSDPFGNGFCILQFDGS
jgi:predicted enzyme related to lactoylglutathione lyase